jgi:hypothetical protein
MRLSVIFFTALLSLLLVWQVEGQGTCMCFNRISKGVRLVENECEAGYLPAMRPRVGNCHCRCCNQLKECGDNTGT